MNTGGLSRGSSVGLVEVVWAAAFLAVLVTLLASLPSAWQSFQAAVSVGSPALVAVKLLEFLVGAVFAASAGLLLWLRPADRMVRFVALTLLSMSAVESGYLNALIDPATRTAADLRVWTLPVMGVRAAEMTCALLLLYVYPDGRFLPSWTRPLAVAWAALNVLFALNPSWPLNVLWGPTWKQTPGWSLLFSAAWVLSGVLARVQRAQLDAAGPGTRLVSRSMKVAAAGFLAYAAVPLLPLDEFLPADTAALLNTAALCASLTLFPVTLFRSMLRHGLHDGPRLMGRALTGVFMGVLVTGTYLLVMLGVAQVLGGADTLLLSVLATVFATLVFAPVRDQVQRRVNRWLYGDRDQPLAALQSVTARLEQARTPQGALQVLAEATAGTLKLPYLALEVHTPEVRHAVVLGARTAAVEVFPLLIGGHEVGKLTVSPGAPLTRDVRSLLRAVAQQAARSVEAWQLDVQVQHSRQVLVDTREDERRRLRRELHDGLGPTLAAQTLRIGSARALLGRDEAAVARLLERLERDVEQAVNDVRRVVEDLRPPALDELGLAGTLERAVRGIAPDSLDAQVLIGALPPLRAAVEVAAYRIALEAVTNVIRHAQAARCTVCLTVDGPDLHIDVSDDGRGAALPTPAGVGLRSMRERAEELGGQFEFGPLAPRGTRVHARLPLYAAPERAGGHHD